MAGDERHRVFRRIYGEWGCTSYTTGCGKSSRGRRLDGEAWHALLLPRLFAGVGDGGRFRWSKTNTSTWDKIKYDTLSKRIARMKGEDIGQRGGEKLLEFTGIVVARRRPRQIHELQFMQPRGSLRSMFEGKYGGARGA